jgi:hypothetical protein
VLRIPVDGWFELLEDSFDLARMSVVGMARTVSALEQQAWLAGLSVPFDSPRMPARGSENLDIVDRTGLLMRTPLLHGAGVQPVSDLAAYSDEVILEVGAPLFPPDSVPTVVVVIDGCVEAHRRHPDVSWVGGAGHMVCGVASLAGTAAEWIAVPVLATRALTFRVADWYDLLEENVEMVRALMAALALEREKLLDCGVSPSRPTGQ